jgi:hypothetical protein
MSGPEPGKPADTHHRHDPKDTTLPIPVQERRPAARPPRTASVDPAVTLTRALVEPPPLGASIAGAAAAAAMTGAAALARPLWPRADWRELPRFGERPRCWAGWLGPGVHVRYTHTEMRWPVER